MQVRLLDSKSGRGATQAGAVRRGEDMGQEYRRKMKKCYKQQYKHKIRIYNYNFW